MLDKQEKRHSRHKRVRAKIFGTKERPRLSVFKSNQHIYAQLIDDEQSKILAAASDLDIKKGNKSIRAKEIGQLIAKMAKNLPAGGQVNKVVFDRGGYKYHGVVKALADGAREGGLIF